MATAEGGEPTRIYFKALWDFKNRVPYPPWPNILTPAAPIDADAPVPAWAIRHRNTQQTETAELSLTQHIY